MVLKIKPWINIIALKNVVFEENGSSKSPHDYIISLRAV